KFLWDGMRLAQESRPEGTDSLYIYRDPGSYEPLARVDKAGKEGPNRILYFHTDVNGAPEEMTDSDGKIVWETGYQVWGNTIQEKDHGRVEQNLRYQAQYLDRETGLHYNLHRYYDPDVGRFIVTDPIGLAGGINLYAYAPNPLGWIDPLGLTCKLTNQQFKNKLKRIRNQTAAGGNRGITGVVSQSDAFKLGEAFVGPNYRIMSNGKGLVSEDGLRTYRFPADKRGYDRINGRPWSKTGKQVNFETKNEDGDVVANIHLDVENIRP
ncbi:RHS repeat-associated core domain-containing protein, partial [Escherichia coli]